MNSKIADLQRFFEIFNPSIIRLNISELIKKQLFDFFIDFLELCE